MTATRHGNPHLTWQLGGQFMELQGREQTKDRLRHFRSNRDQALMLGGLIAWQSVDAAPRFLQLTTGSHARKNHPGSSDSIEITGTQHTFLAGQIKDALSVGNVAHSQQSMFHIFVESKQVTKFRNNLAFGYSCFNQDKTRHHVSCRQAG